MTSWIPYSIQLQVQQELQDWRPPPTIANKYSKCHGPNRFPINLTFHKRLSEMNKLIKYSRDYYGFTVRSVDSCG